jgi:outer membrane protein
MSARISAAGFVLAAWFIAGSSTARAAVPPQRPLTLQECVRLAIAHDPTVAQQKATLAQAEESYAKQKAQAYPSITASLQNFLAKSSNYSGAYAVIGATQQSVTSVNTAQVGTQYTLFSGGLAFLQLAQTRAQVDQDRQALEHTERELASEVTSAFYTVAQKQAEVAIDRDDLAYQRKLVADAEAKARVGVAAGVDVLRARVALEKSTAALAAAITAADDAADALAQRIGVPFGTSFAIPTTIAQPALPSGPVEALVARAEHDRSEIASARAQLRAAELQRRSYLRELFPQVQLQASVGNQFSPTLAALEQQQIDQQFALANQQRIAIGLPPLPRSADPIVPRGSPGFWQIQAVSTFSLPILDYGARAKERAQDDAQLAAARAALNAAESKVALDVRDAFRAARSASAQVAYAEDEVRLGRRSAHIARIQYEAGVISLTDVLQAQQTARQAEGALLDARVAYVEAIVHLRVALGTTNPVALVADL